MQYRLQDIIDMEQFQQLQNRLNEIYSFPSAIIDNEGRVLTATAWQDVCTKFHRRHSECERECIKSDQYILRHLHEANPAVSYRCPHGLIDNAAPIIIEGVHYANFFTGQFFLAPPDLNFFKAQAERYGFDKEAYIEAVKKVPIWTQAQLNSYLFFIKGLIEVISGIGLKNLREMEARKRIQEREEKHRTIIQTAMDGFWLLDRQGRLLEVNDAYCRMSGYAERELVGMRIHDLEYEETEDDTETHIQGVMAHGEDRFESRHRRKDGSVFDVEVSVKYRPDDEGQFIVFLRDITKRKNDERTLRESEEQYRTVVSSANEGIILQHHTGKIITCNAAAEKMFGLRSGEALGSISMSRDWKTFREDGSPLPAADHPSMHTLATGEPCRNVVMKIIRDIHDFYWISVNTNPVFKEGEKKPHAVVITISDITERKREERETAVIAEIGRVISLNLHIDAVYEQFAALAGQLLSFDSLVVNTKAPDEETLEVAYASGMAIPGRTVGDRFPLYGSITQEAIRKRTGMIILSENEEELFSSFPHLAVSVRAGIHSVMCVPLIARNTVIGSLVIRSKKPRAYAERDLRLGERIGMQIAGAVANAWLFKDLVTKDKNLRESEERLREIIESTPAGYFFIDRAGVFQHVNRAWLQMHGFDSADAVLGRHFSMTQPESFLATAQAHVQNLLSGNSIMSGDALRLRKDRSVGHHTFSAHPVAKAGWIIGLEGFIIDTSAQRLLEERYLMLFQEMLNGFALHEIILDDRGNAVDYRFLAVNPAFERMTGLKADVVVNRTVREVLPEIERHWIETYGKVALTGEPVSFEDYSSDLKKHFEITAFRPEPYQFACIVSDITDRKQVDAEREKLVTQLSQAQKMESVGRLAGGVAHDFNNMLGVILGHVDLLMDGMAPSQPHYENLLEMRKVAERSADLTKQLLAFARKQIIMAQVIDLNETVEAMLKMLRRLIGEDIDLAWIRGAGVLRVKADPSQVQQVLTNLCVNARDAIAGVGKLTIETDRVVLDAEFCVQNPGVSPGEYVLLAVSDNGCGMEKEMLDHIFDPFFTTKNIGQGTGLGLSMVYGAIKQNHGFISVDSEPGKGSTFKIYLPRHRGTVEQPQSEEPKKLLARGQETILLVEDQAELLDVITLLLKRLGYQVVAASSPGEAVRLAEEYQGKINLLMTDVIMPEMNGRDLADRLQSLHPKLKCLFMSGYTADAIDSKGLSEKSIHFIQKPFSVGDVAVKIRQALG